MMWIVYIFWLVAAFLFMEFTAWFMHKYVMHGLLWKLHEDHHDGGYHPFQKNDAFFLIFAVPSWLCIMLGLMNQQYWVAAIGFGILVYGICYFIVHDIIIHQRFKLFTRSNNRYIKVIRWAHKMHHKHRSKHNGESFGMLIVAAKYWNKVKQDEERAASPTHTSMHL